MVPFIHGMSLTILSYSTLGHCGLGEVCPNSERQNLIFLYSAAYFLFDTFSMIYYNLADINFIIHHIMGIIGYVITIYFDSTGELVMLFGFIGEISNGPMHVSSVMKSLGLRHTHLHNISEIAYISLYSYFRTIKGFVIIYYVLMGNTWGHRLTIPLMLGMFGLSYITIIKMARILIRRYNEYTERKKAGVNLEWVTHNQEVEKLQYFKKSLTKQE